MKIPFKRTFGRQGKEMLLFHDAIVTLSFMEAIVLFVLYI